MGITAAFLTIIENNFRIDRAWSQLLCLAVETQVTSPTNKHSWLSVTHLMSPCCTLLFKITPQSQMETSACLCLPAALIE